VHFEITPDILEICRPDGEKFLSFVDLGRLREQERQRADVTLTQLEREQKRNEVLAAKLREMGIDPV
jgi:hypothetical protein